MLSHIKKLGWYRLSLIVSCGQHIADAFILQRKFEREAFTTQLIYGKPPFAAWGSWNNNLNDCTTTTTAQTSGCLSGHAYKYLLPFAFSLK